jgi:hypothetical protein
MAARLVAACVVTALLVPAGALAGSKRADAECLLVDEVNEVRREHGLRPFADRRLWRAPPLPVPPG